MTREAPNVESDSNTRSQRRPRGVWFVMILVIGECATSFQSLFGVQLDRGNPSAFAWQGFVLAVLAWGLWRAKAWAWMLLLITSAVGVVAGLVVLSFGVPAALYPPELYFAGAGIALNLTVVLYATRTNVKRYFRRTSIRDELV